MKNSVRYEQAEYKLIMVLSYFSRRHSAKKGYQLTTANTQSTV